jgi:hypothetical protein
MNSPPFAVFAPAVLVFAVLAGGGVGFLTAPPSVADANPSLVSGLRPLNEDAGNGSVYRATSRIRSGGVPVAGLGQCGDLAPSFNEPPRWTDAGDVNVSRWLTSGEGRVAAATDSPGKTYPDHRYRFKRTMRGRAAESAEWIAAQRPR